MLQNNFKGMPQNVKKKKKQKRQKLKRYKMFLSYYVHACGKL